MVLDIIVETTRSYLANQRVPYLWRKERGREKEIWASAPGWNMDTQGIPAAHITILAKRQDKKNPDSYHWQSWSMTQKSKRKNLLPRQDLTHGPLEPKTKGRRDYRPQ